jgi:hypothetical protein
MITCRPDMTPLVLLQQLYYIANFERHESRISLLPRAQKPAQSPHRFFEDRPLGGIADPH